MKRSIAALILLAFAPLVMANGGHAFGRRILQLIAQYGAETAGVYFQNAEGEIFTHNADTVFHAASTMKVPVMMELFRQIEQGKLKLDQTIEIKNEFKSIMDGSPYSLTREEDGDQEIYASIGKTMTLEQLMERMINTSSNLATNLLIQIADPANVRKLMDQIGASDMHVLRGVEDIKAYEAGKNNTTTPRALAACLKAIMDSKLYKEESRAKMLSILESQHFRNAIPEGLKGRGLRIANKDGWITEIYHDAAIIRDGKGNTHYLVVMSRGIKKTPEDGEKFVANVARDLWKYYYSHE